MSAAPKQSPLVPAVLTASSAFFLLWGYEFVRSASNTLFKLAYGKESLPLVLAAVPPAVVLTLYIYGKLLDRFGPRKTILYTSLGSGALLFLGYLAIEAGSDPATAFVYIVRECYVVLIIEQYWSFLNSTLKEDSAKNLNGLITGLASLGAILGGWTVHFLSEPLGTPAMLIFCAASMLPAALLSEIAYKKCGEPTHEKKEDKKDPLALGLFRSQPVLVSLMLIIVSTQIVSTMLGLHFQGILQDVIPDRDAQTAFSGKFYANINTVAAVFQFILAPVLLRWIPLMGIHILIPLIHLGFIGYAIYDPTLASVGLAFLTFKAFDYSIFRAAKEILYIPLSFDARFRAKEVIDVFGYRFGKGGTSLIVVFLQRAGIVFDAIYPWIALISASVWFGLIERMRRQEGKKLSS